MVGNGPGGWVVAAAQLDGQSAGLKPVYCGGAGPIGRLEYSPRAMGKQTAPVGITDLGDAAEASGLAAGRRTGHQSEPGGQLRPLVKALRLVTAATRAVALSNPLPGTVRRRWMTG